MIEKILSELQVLKEDAVDKWDGGASHRAYTKAIEIVQEVAKEYGGGWIPVKERLPECENKYGWVSCIVTVNRSHYPTSTYDICDSPYDETIVMHANYHVPQKIWHLECDEQLNALMDIEDAPLNGDYVIAWMPLRHHIRRESSMSRLTYTDAEMEGFINMDCPVKGNDHVFEFCNRVCDEFQNNCPFEKLGKKLKDYEDKEEQGLLIELPCKVGDKLYQIKNDELYELILIGLVYDEANKEWLLELAVQIGLEWHKIIRTKERIGTTIFLTRSEAEEALAKMGGK